MKHGELKFLNVTDDRWPESYGTIIYTGELHPYEDGFLYSFSYPAGNGFIIDGTGLVVSERYSKMSSEEIELTCAVANPPSREDIYNACICGDMTEAYAEKYSGISSKS